MVIASTGRWRQVLLAVVLTALPLAARAQGCQGMAGAAEFRLNAQMPPPQYRHTQTRSQLSAVQGHGHMSSDRSHAGLTQTRTAFAVRPQIEYRTLPGGRLCARVRAVEAEWRMTVFTVDVAAEYAPGSCPYEQILRHENEHVTIHQRAFATAEREIRFRLAELARQTQAFVFTGSPKQAAEQVAARFMAAAQPAIQGYERETARENGAIDTPTNYRAVSARCRDW